MSLTLFDIKPPLAALRHLQLHPPFPFHLFFCFQSWSNIVSCCSTILLLFVKNKMHQLKLCQHQPTILLAEITAGASSCFRFQINFHLSCSSTSAVRLFSTFTSWSRSCFVVLIQYLSPNFSVKGCTVGSQVAQWMRHYTLSGKWKHLACGASFSYLALFNDEYSHENSFYEFNFLGATKFFREQRWAPYLQLFLE